MSLTRTVAVAVFVALLATGARPVAAQDKDADKELVKKAKEAAAANLKKCSILKPTVVETNNFIVAGAMTEEQAKALGAVLERTLPVARKTARLDDKDTPWKGKLTIYFLPDTDEYKSFMRKVLQTQPDGNAYSDLRAEPPFLVDPVSLPGKPTDADLYHAVAARVAGEMLKAKVLGRESIPDWLRDGFGQAVALRAEGTTSKRYQTYKSASRTAIFGPKGGKPPTLGDVWGDAKVPNGDVLATSFAEFLAFGPKAVSDKFDKFLDGLRPTENVAAPTTVQALAAAGFTDKDHAALEQAWKRWVTTGK
jgi:hypothetical protein